MSLEFADYSTVVPRRSRGSVVSRARSETAVALPPGHVLGVYAQILHERGVNSPEAQSFRQSRQDDAEFQREAGMVDDMMQHPAVLPACNTHLCFGSRRDG